MKYEITAIYCVCDDYIRSKGILGWPNEKMSYAEVMTTLITAGQFFSGNIEKSRHFLQEHGYIPNMLSKQLTNVCTSYLFRFGKAYLPICKNKRLFGPLHPTLS